MYILVPAYCDRMEPVISAITESIQSMCEFLEKSLGVTLKNANEYCRKNEEQYDFEEWMDTADDNSEADIRNDLAEYASEVMECPEIVTHFRMPVYEIVNKLPIPALECVHDATHFFIIKCSGTDLKDAMKLIPSHESA
jgi:hypothetical protein